MVSRIFRSSVILVCALAALAGPLHAGRAWTRFQHLSLAEGLPEAGVTSLLQDHLGFLWIGTLNGLVRYDGVRFETYKPIPEDSESLGGRFVLSLLEDRRGDLWIGTRRGGLSRYDRARDRFVRFEPREGEGGVSFDSVTALLEDRQGRIWIGTGDLEAENRGRGLDVYDPAARTFRHFRSDQKDEDSISADNIVSLLEGPDGSIWVGTLGGGLNRFDPKTETFESFLHDPRDPRSLPANNVTKLRLGPDGTLWIATAGGGVGRFDASKRTFERVGPGMGEEGGLANDWVYALHVADDGEVWAGTWYGALHRLDRNSERWIRYENDPEDPASLVAASGILALLEDYSGILWVGTLDAGLDRLDPYSLKFPQLRREHAEELPADRITTLLADATGKIWIGSENGLEVLLPESDEVVHYRHEEGVEGSLGSNRVLSLYEDREGRIWVGTAGAGLYRFETQDRTFTPVRKGESKGRGTKQDLVFSILEDRNGLLWLGTAFGGLTRYDPVDGRWSRFTAPGEDADTIGHQIVRVQLEDEEGILWLGTDAGLQRFDPVREAFSTFVEPLTGLDMIHSLHLDGKGRLWVGTFNGGLHLFDRETRQSRAFTERDGLAHDSVYGILEDEEGHFWLSTGNGISHFDPETETFRNYGTADGLRGHRFDGGAVITRDGQILFASTEGLSAFFPRYVQDNPVPPKVVLTDFKVFYKSVAPEPGGALEEDVSIAESILLTHEKNVISFEFAGLHFSDPDRIRYAFRLDPLHADWNDVGHQRSATFTNLRPGDYTFRVRAANPDGVWNEEGTSIGLRILPPWWQSWWAYTLYALGLVVALVGGDRLQRARVVKRERALAREEQAELRAEAAELQAKAAEAQARALQAENDRKSLELEEARRLQLSLLPREIPCPPELEIAASMHTATEVGGDYYDFDLAPDGTLTVVIGDATGHGTKAGTMVTATKTLFSLLGRDSETLEFMRRATRVLKRMQVDNLFMALSLLRIHQGELEVVGAGMPPVFLFRKSAGVVEEIPLEGAPLGSLIHFPYARSRVRLAPGDSVVLMSDGLPEMLDPQGEMLGYERVASLVGELGELDAEAAVRRLERAAEVWADGRDRADDMTLVVLRVR